MFLAQVPQASLNPPPLIQMDLQGFFLNKYAPLNLPQPLSDIRHHYLKPLPRFNGEDDNTTQRHIETFCAFDENINIEQLDVVTRLFV